MSTKCLVTSLNGVVDNEELLINGKIQVKISAQSSPSISTQGFLVCPTEDADMVIAGNGYFTDSTFQQNLGKKLHLTAGAQTTVYVSNGNFYVHIPKKLSQLFMKDKFYVNGVANGKSKSFDISQLAYSNNLTFLDIAQTEIYGDIKALSKMTNLADLYVSVSKVTGDVESLKDCGIKTFMAENTLLSGDIKYLSKCNFLILQGSTGFFGNIEDVPNVAHAYLHGNSVTGDPSKLGDNAAYITGSCHFTWKTERDNSYKIIAFLSANFGDDLDAMLINQAKCQAGSIKTINVVGNRTSASDSAIATLQSKGYTVSIS